ncbi:MAG: hypothetical protein ACUBOA_04440 [Candidatus Loosdrechtia sp.]|uniref:hypothetical protein n=1 Tax=Candidatus Loosdrechtia sp. TaxID=3101272 RepID=UPI003A67ADA2|nr:MAG: hypothetical protein QY305_08165 [Candidatus Jettenia sp. AMX2]
MDQHDLKEHFEAILGRELVGGFGDEVALRETVGLYSIEQGNATSREIGVTGSSTKRCGQSSLLTVGGLSFVGVQGKAESRLSDFHCERLRFLHPVIVAATPRTPSPVFVTAVPTIIDNGGDVQIVLHTWAPDGSPAPNVLVTWLCRVQSLPVIL